MSEQKVYVETASVDDARQIAHLYVHNFGEYAGNAEQAALDIREMIEMDGHTKILVLRDKADPRSVLGYSAIRQFFDGQVPKLEITNIAISNLYQGLGYGRVLGRETLVHCRRLISEAGLLKAGVFCTIDPSKHASQAVFRGLGFQDEFGAGVYTRNLQALTPPKTGARWRPQG